MSDKKAVFPRFNFFKKIKLSKNTAIIISIILGLIIVLIFCSSLENKKPLSSKTTTTEEYTTMIAYTKTVEDKLKNVIENIAGVEKADVMITFENSIELVISATKESKTVSSGGGQTTITIETPVLINENGKSKPIVLQQKLPSPKSVFIVAKGADNPKTKLDIIKAIEVLFSLPASKIEVLAGK